MESLRRGDRLLGELTLLGEMALGLLAGRVLEGDEDRITRGSDVAERVGDLDLVAAREGDRDLVTGPIT